jgi:hypothetical protein
MCLRLGLALAALLGIAGCGGVTTVELDGGPGRDGAVGPTGALHVESETMLALFPGSRASILARWIGVDGRPVSGGLVTFALQGMPRDSTLDALSARSDADGRARVELQAGTMPAIFRVRIAADGATPAYVDVAVGTMGFGTMVVAIEGGDRRAIAQRTVVLHQGEIACADAIARAEGDRSRVVPEASREIELAALPAGQPFTVVARGTGPSGTLLAAGCVERVQVPVDNRVRATVELQALPLAPDGEYATFVDIASTGSASALVDALSHALGTGIASAGGDARLLLDALDQELRARGQVEIADSLVRQRRTGEPESALQRGLSAASQGPSIAADALLDEAQVRLAAISIDGRLSLAVTREGTVAASFVRRSVLVGPASDERTTADLSARGVEAHTPVAARWIASDDALVLEALPIELPLGRLLLATLDGLARARAAHGPAELMLEEIGCAPLSDWVEERPDVASACRPECVLEACKRAARVTLEMIEGGASALDDARTRLLLAGTLASDDADGDLTVDAMGGVDLAGRWSSADSAVPAEALTPTLAASRVTTMR